VTDGSTPGDMELVSLYKKEIGSTLEPDLRVEFSDRWTLSGSDSAEGVRTAIDRLLSRKAPDVIVALGVIASTDVLDRKSIPKPVIAPFVARFALELKILTLKIFSMR